MKHKKIVLLLAATLVAILLFAGWLLLTGRFNDAKTKNNHQQNTDTNKESSTAKRVCPDAWYDNRMPGPAEDAGSSSQYFIVAGERVELEELDVDWVKANCAVNEPQVVQ